MLKNEFARIFGMSEADVLRFAGLSREAQKLGLAAEPEVGLMFLTAMPVGCSASDVFVVIDNMLYDQHANASDTSHGKSPLGDRTFVPDWDSAYSWAFGYGWQLESAVHDEKGITVTLRNGEEQVRGMAMSGRVAMLETAVQAVRKSCGTKPPGE